MTAAAPDPIVAFRPDLFAGKAVLVTGATSGIGRATAIAFARTGAQVLAVGRDAARGRALEGEAPGAITFLALDVTETGAAARMVEAAMAPTGRLDIAVNNAGWQEPRAPLAEQPERAFDRAIDTNLRAVFRAMQAEIAAMAPAGGGAIVNVASVSGMRNPNPGLALYSASKAAVISLTRSAALEYGPAGLRLNAVAPGRVDTPMMRGSGIADMAVVAAGLPVRRLGRPEEVAAAILWLASDAAAFVTGHVLAADGGFLAT
ncbi:MAG: glucose 1-dehydrogenase [Alphaproteobacteria bacterium]|jgi:NAD(P)-dependent dehydrogenase (short-subunit alcohol dehydrogenase family)|nr:glucose 1-dehydrogenase [Alphaproteobacteria bacterium]